VFTNLSKDSAASIFRKKEEELFFLENESDRFLLNVSKLLQGSMMSYTIFTVEE
jgi:hypothetical protein